MWQQSDLDQMRQKRMDRGMWPAILARSMVRIGLLGLAVVVIWHFVAKYW